MGFPWKKLAKVGVAVGSVFVPGLQAAIFAVEDNLPDLKGPQKKAAAIAMAEVVVATIEEAAGADVIKDDQVIEATSKFVDAFVAAQNAKAAAEEARQALMDAIASVKASKNG